MLTRKLSYSEKIFLFLISNTILFSVIFALKFFGLIIDSVLLLLITAASLEVIYFVISVQLSVNKNVQNLAEVEKNIANIRENEEKMHTLLTYINHQMKTVQHDINTLRKSPVLRANGNSHPKVHA